MSFLDDWKEWSTAKKAISIIVVCCIGIIIVAMIAGGLSSDKNTSPTNSNDNSVDSTAPQASGKQVKIIYSGDWSGAAGDVSSTNSISGSGEKTIDMDDDASIISANAQKQDASGETLTIQILKDGKVIEESSTDAEYGVASVSATL